MSMCEARRQMPGEPGRVPVADGEAGRASTRDEATRPRHETGSTGSALLKAALTRENLQCQCRFKTDTLLRQLPI